jgi:hypothetical protein
MCRTVSSKLVTYSRLSLAAGILSGPACESPGGRTERERLELRTPLLVQLEGTETVEVDIVVEVTSDEMMEVSTNVSITDFDESGDLFVPVLLDIDCAGQIRNAKPLDISSGSSQFPEIAAQFEDKTSPNEFHCLLTIAPQSAVPLQDLAMSIEATAYWRGDADAVELLVDAEAR